MATHYSNRFRDDGKATYDAFNKAIERYDFMHFLCEATYRSVLSKEEEKRVIEQSDKSRQKMCEHLLTLMLDGGKRQQQFILFVESYGDYVQSISQRELLPFKTSTDLHCSAVEHSERLSNQDSDSDSPMELVGI